MPSLTIRTLTALLTVRLAGKPWVCEQRLASHLGASHQVVVALLQELALDGLVTVPDSCPRTSSIVGWALTSAGERVALRHS